MNRFAAIVAPIALAGALSACAVEPYPTTAVNPYQGNAYTVAPSAPTYYAASPYATPAPAPVVQPYAPAYAPYATVRPDPTGYCREAYANYADAQNRAVYSGNPVDIGRAQNTANFYRRDCG